MARRGFTLLEPAQYAVLHTLDTILVLLADRENARAARA